MRLLLDTHVVVWAVAEPGVLSAAARESILGAERICVSVVSPWELTIKAALGKIVLHRPVEEICGEFVREFGADVLPVALPHVLEVGRLDPHHGDPFDRLILAQARLEGLTIVTRDHIFAAYGGPVIRA